MEEQRLWAHVTAECLDQGPARLPPARRLLVLGDDEAQKAALVSRLRAAPPAAPAESGSGLQYRFLHVRDEQRARLGVWILDDEPALAAALLPLALARRPADATALLLGSMTAPWRIRDAVARWAGLLSAAAGSPLAEAGVGVVVVVTRTEHMRVLERDRGYEAGHFDAVQLALRRLCLSLGGAALVYVSLREDRNCDLLLQYLLHRAYALPFRIPALLLERDALFVPAGWDSEARIRVLAESLPPDASPYEEIVRRPPGVRPLPDVSALPDQEFLAALQGALSRTEEAPASDSRAELVGAVQRAGPSRRPRPAAPPPKSQAAVVAVPGSGDTILHTFFKNLLDKRRSLPADRPDGLGGRTTYEDDQEPVSGENQQKRRVQRSISQAQSSAPAASRFDSRVEDPLEEQPDETQVHPLPEYFLMSHFGESSTEDNAGEERALHSVDGEEVVPLDIKHTCEDSSS